MSGEPVHSELVTHPQEFVCPFSTALTIVTGTEGPRAIATSHNLDDHKGLREVLNFSKLSITIN